MNDKWKVVVTVNVERIRPVINNPAAAQIVSSQVSTWGDISDTPGEAFENLSRAGFSAYTAGLPKVIEAVLVAPSEN